MNKIQHIGLLSLVLVLIVGCSTTKQAERITNSGFLGDIYPLMKEGEAGEPILVYHSPAAQSIPSDYFTKVLLDPIFIYRGSKDRLEGVSQKDAQLAADTFYATMYDRLSKDYEMVTVPGENTLRIQIAIVGLEESSPFLDVVSSTPAPFNLIGLTSALTNLATGEELFKGAASIEIKVKNGGTGDLIFAGVDTRLGTANLDSEIFDSWSDVNQAFAYWADMTRYRLCVSREEESCVSPEE